MLITALHLLLPLALTTVAEQSGYTRTGRYDEVVRLCAEFPRAFPGRARCLDFGTTPEGRPMLAIAASADGVLDSQAARARGRQVVLFQGAIHGGEVDGKDAGFAVLRELLSQRSPALQRVTALFVPVFNVDGHERMGRHNRPNQAGPQEMGWRTTAQNLNLNRDGMKAEAPEMQAMLRLLNAWDPVLYIDLHTTDGADFQPDVAVLIEPQRAGPEALRREGRALREALFARLTAAGHLPLDFYPSFLREDDPASGFAAGIAPPRFQYGYWPLRGRFAVLVETHSWKDYRARVRAAADTVRGLVELAAERAAAWPAACAAADEEAARLGGQAVPLLYDNTDRVERLRFPGYAYTFEASPVSGGLRVRYDPRRKLVWDVPFHPEVRAVLSVTAPRGGYLVPPAHAAWVAEKLRLHGLSFEVLPDGRTMAVETYRVREKKFRGEPYEGRLLVQVKGAWSAERRPIARGTLYVPLAQRGGRVAVHLLEPEAPDSLVSWGFFNAHLEQKEYMEPYVAEAIGEQLLREPRVREEFMKRLRDDPQFARDAAARLRFFYQRHPSWDERYDLYPVYRVTAPMQ